MGFTLSIFHTDDARTLCWTEENRLQGFLDCTVDGSLMACYVYDADGERCLKLTSPRMSVQQNGATLPTLPLNNPTFYPSPLITLTKKGYTKHYFEENRRVCSKIGGGFGNVVWDSVTTQIPPIKEDYNTNSYLLFKGIWNFTGACLGVTPKFNTLPDVYSMLYDHERLHNESENAFYYHSDHLGSASYLTNDNAQVSQTLNYLPYGEDWVDLQYNLDPRLGQYTFNGKEKDSESGFHYYGARYYWSETLTGWLSVDPMADKYPGISPYAYCVWNPVGAVDPDGEKPRLPRWLRIMTSKHVYRAIDYKIRHGGNLDVWETSSGCIFASVQSRNANVDDKGAVMIEAKMFRPEGYSSEAQIKATTDFFVNAESWMDEPATSVVDFGLKTAAEIGYSMVNDPAILLTGYSLAGTEATSSEKCEAFVGVAAGSLGRPLSKGMGTIKTAGKTGLAKYNDFVRKMGNYQGRTKKEMGRLYQNNKKLNSAVSTYENFEKGISGTSVFRKEE